MALSDEEQQLLAQLERSLAEDDPTLAHLMRGTEPRPHARAPKQTVAGIIGFIVGLSLLVLGMQTHWTVSVAGFVVMAASAAWGLGLVRARPKQVEPEEPRRVPTSAKARSAGSSSMMDKFEQRWRRRQDEGY